MDPDLFDDATMKACARAAKRVHVVNRRYVDYGDILQEMYLWVVKQQKYVNEWREQGQHGANKLHVALYRAGHAYVARERAKRTGSKTGDFFWYTPAMLEELLPDVWAYTRWEASSVEEPDMPRGKSKPSEGGNRRAMMIDLAYAISTMPVDDQRLLRDRFHVYPNESNESLGRRWNLTGDALRKRVERLLVKLVDRLGGEPPFWPAGRKAQSNASAQYRTRRQEQ